MCIVSSTRWMTATCPLNGAGRGVAVALVRLVHLGAERGPAGVERDRDVRRRLVAQQVGDHREEPEHRVGGLARRRRELVHREREERPVGHRVTVDQEESGRRSGSGRRDRWQCVAHGCQPICHVRHDDHRPAPTAGTLIERMGIVVTEASRRAHRRHHARGREHPAVRPAARRRVRGAGRDAGLRRRHGARRRGPGGGRHRAQRHPPPVGARPASSPGPRRPCTWAGPWPATRWSSRTRTVGRSAPRG